MRRLTITYLLLLLCHTVTAQTVAEGKHWLREMQRTGIKHVVIDSIVHTWRQKGSGYAHRAMKQTEAAAESKRDKGSTIALLIAASQLSQSESEKFTPANYQMADSAYRMAKAWDNEDLLIAAAFNVSDFYLLYGRRDEGLFSLLKGISLAEAKGYNRKQVSLAKLRVTSHLYQTHNYEIGVEIGRALLQDLPLFPAREQLGAYNNLGLCYRAVGRYDSAFAFFDKARAAAQAAGNGVWVGIATGNMGDVLRLQGRAQEALPYWQTDIDSSLKYNEAGNAGLSMIWVSEELFRQGQRDKAWALLNRANTLIGEVQSSRLAFFEVKSKLAKQSGRYAEALDAWQRYSSIRDSLNAQASQNNFAQLKLKLDYENTAAQFQELTHQRQTEVLWRNFLLVVLLLVVFAAWVLYSRQKLKFRVTNQAKQLAEAETKAATEQLALFTQLVIEKNSQIEELSVSMQQLQQTNEEELTQVSILTEEDWSRFKKLFEKAHPGFFEKLVQLAPDITQAEMRLAALMRLNLDSKTMANMQGISQGGLRSNRSRLRQRLHLQVTESLEAFIQQL
jgi:tetratricopeptide (TPR) repeat protein/DNA-binding CsgD family transcriptional regulator